jgi:hypothetical protein
MTDAEAVKLITLGRNQRSKISALWGLVAHDKRSTERWACICA